MSRLSEMLTLYCRVHNIDVRALAADIGTSPATANRLQNGKPCSQEVMLKVINWLFSRTRSGKADKQGQMRVVNAAIDLGSAIEKHKTAARLAPPEGKQ